VDTVNAQSTESAPANSSEPDAMDVLVSLRSSIDNLDAAIVHLLRGTSKIPRL